MRKGRNRFTIMIVPHSERKGLSFDISFWGMLFFLTLFVALAFGFFMFTINYSDKNRDLALQGRDLDEAEASLDAVLDEVHSLVQAAGSFEQALGGALNTLGVEGAEGSLILDTSGDLSSLINARRADENSFNEIVELKRLKATLTSSVSSLDSISKIISNQRDLMADIPNISPVKNNAGYVSQYYGPAIHPFYHNWYIHKGIDIASFIGTPLVSTANGEVYKVNVDSRDAYGLYVVIRHKYGFYTKYGHMSRIYVRPGQRVSQGEVIGLMGTTGLSTGSHVHYEVQVGTEVVDPLTYLSIETFGKPQDYRYGNF
ncbi:MAG: M23 family metallopeptidase [Spirochaetaceae bacterium]|jgi:murein DD-endopeptidase MepM/ murein hydrolase activator NlpD|nr:M23 family metallopeptidase [Spirochaetaceae bacterium]